MAVTISEPLLVDIEDTAKPEASKREQNQDPFMTILNGLKSSASSNYASLGMDHSQEQLQPGLNESNPSSKPIQMENEADEYSTDSESEPDDDKAQPLPQISDRKRTQYKKFSSWSVSSYARWPCVSNDLTGYLSTPKRSRRKKSRRLFMQTTRLFRFGVSCPNRNQLC